MENAWERKHFFGSASGKCKDENYDVSYIFLTYKRANEMGNLVPISIIR
jgi:hypothetical protein